ncbi:hypothetical protein ACQ859_06280 [Roseateles chitinivorans]|uniref:hypothetical protein n=1 Tax=Roseateles chitinivorans TaxID=2917965 RepID=UPI003D67ECCE
MVFAARGADAAVVAMAPDAETTMQNAAISHADTRRCLGIAGAGGAQALEEDRSKVIGGGDGDCDRS